MPNAPSKKPAENTARLCAGGASRDKAMPFRIANTTKILTRYPVSVREYLHMSTSECSGLPRHPTCRLRHRRQKAEAALSDDPSTSSIVAGLRPSITAKHKVKSSCLEAEAARLPSLARPISQLRKQTATPAGLLCQLRVQSMLLHLARRVLIGGTHETGKRTPGV